jgi:phosphorylcholine metabolism protein LicD
MAEERLITYRAGKTAAEKLLTIPHDIIALIYKMVKDVTDLFDKHDITYWADGGTLLGAVRHGGMIPWDDDADLGLLEKDRLKLLSLKPILNKCGYDIKKHSLVDYKIFYKGRPIVKNSNYTFPFVDIFFYRECKRPKDRYIASNPAIRREWPNAYFSFKETKKLVYYPFGPYKIKGIKQHETYFNRLYGSDWNKVAYRQWDHQAETSIKKVKVNLTPEDRKPVLPVDVLPLCNAKKGHKYNANRKKKTAMQRLKTTPKNVIAEIYKIVEDVTNLFDKNKITYWGDGGTLLGAVRHSGMIPWDDDADLGLLASQKKKFLKLKPKLEKCGYKVTPHWLGYKISYTKNKDIVNTDYSFPFIDIFFYVKDKANDRYLLESELGRKYWPNAYFTFKEVSKIVDYPFGPYKVKGIKNHTAYFNRLYGHDWDKIAYRQYDHENEKHVRKIKVKLTKKDREPFMGNKVLKLCNEK